jgi:hypothetical protein
MVGYNSKKGLIPDIHREYLISRIEIESDPDSKLLYTALLHGYDRGELVMRWDPWQQSMIYTANDIQ